MKYSLRPYQQEAVDSVYKALRERDDNPCVVLPTGCHAQGHPILMYDGSIKNVEDIVVGDVVMGPDGRRREVWNLIRGRSKMIKITPFVEYGHYEKIHSFIVNERHEMPYVCASSFETRGDKVLWSQLPHFSRPVKQYLLTKEYVSQAYFFVRMKDCPSLYEAMPFTVEEMPEDDFFGFTVDEDNLYLDGFEIAHHNCGKSLVLGTIASDAVSKWGGRVLILAHVKELLEQNAAKIRSLCPEIKVGVYSAGLKSRDTTEQVIVAGIQSVYNKADKLDRFDLIIVDECHLIAQEGDGMYRTFLEDEKKINPHVRIIGLTATPYRLKGGVICKPENILNFVCYEAGLREMIAEGYLSPIVPKGGSMDTNFDGLHIRNGEFIPEEVDELMGKERTVQNACAEVVALTKHRKAVLIFGCSVKHCQKIKKHIEEQSGEECAIVTGETPSDERAEILERIKGHSVKTGLFGEEKKPLKYLVNCAVLTTGFDAPNIDCVVMMRPTASPGLLVQCAGRGLRLSPDTGKSDCLFLDFGGNIVRHGPLDAIRVKEGGHRKRDDEQPPAKKCPKCQALVPTMRMVCPDCGYEWPAREATHEESASTVGVITGQITTAEYDVLDINYQKWLKRGDDAAPPTVCIEYIVADNLYKREWICPEHNGYARRKFEKWWEEHRIDETVEFPETADEAVAMARNGLLKNVKRITVRQVTGERFDRITGYVFDEAKTERQLEFEDTSWVGDAPTGDIGEEIPF